MTVNLKHSFGLFGKGHIVYPDGKAEGICEEDGSVHWVDRTVPDVEQCCCVVKAQVTARRDDQPEKLLGKPKLKREYLSSIYYIKPPTLHAYPQNNSPF